MGLFGGLFESTTKSTTKTSVTDQRVGIEGAGNVGRIDTTGSVIVSSDDVAKLAIEAVETSARDNLSVSTNFLEKAFTSVLKLTDTRLNSADQNFQKSQEFAAGIIAKEQETSDDRLIKVVTWGMVAAVIVVAVQSGALKGFLK